MLYFLIGGTRYTTELIEKDTFLKETVLDLLGLLQVASTKQMESFLKMHQQTSNSCSHPIKPL